MTNKLHLITILTLTSILITGGLGITQFAYSSNSDSDKKINDKKSDEKKVEMKKIEYSQNSAKSDDDDDDDDDKNDKIKICHFPPGNPSNAHTINISKSALGTHLAHGDTKGACLDDDDDEDNENQITKPTITIINNVASDPQPFGITVSPIVGSPEIVDSTTSKYTVESHTKVTISGLEDRPLLITGDGNCPENNGGFVNIENGQNITCIYNDRSAGIPGPAPTVTLHVEIIDPVLGVNPTFTVDGNPVILDTPIALIADHTSVIIQTDDGVPGDSDPDKEILPSNITGDGNCPEVIGGTITLSEGQNIKCIFVYGKVIEPGTIFYHNTLEFSFIDDGFGDSCDNLEVDSSGNVIPKPCIELANAHISDQFLIVDSVLNTDDIIIVFSVIEKGKVTKNPPEFASSPICIQSGIGPHIASYATIHDPDEPPLNPVDKPTGLLGIEIECTLFEADEYKVGYALIKTV